MKGITTIEMIRQIIEDKSKKFKSELVKEIEWNHEGKVLYFPYYNEAGDKMKDDHCIINDWLLGQTWQPYQEHYTFDQAYKDCMTGDKYQRYQDGKPSECWLENNGMRITMVTSENQNGFFGASIDGPGITWVKID